MHEIRTVDILSPRERVTFVYQNAGGVRMKRTFDPGITLKIPFDDIVTALNQRGCRKVFDEGILVFTNEQDQKDLQRDKVKVNPILSDEEIEKIVKGNPPELYKKMKACNQSGRDGFINYFVKNKITHPNIVAWVSQLWNYDLLKAITLVKEDDKK